MTPVTSHTHTSLPEFRSAESLQDEVHYYKAMLSGPIRTDQDTLRILSPDTLRKKMEASERRLQRLQGKRR